MNPLIVHLHGRWVGVLDDDGERRVFRYDNAWLSDAGALPLSRKLPLQSEPFEGRGVDVFFGGLLPEADSRDQIARNLGISAKNDFAMLERIGGDSTTNGNPTCSGAHESGSPKDCGWKHDSVVQPTYQNNPNGVQH